MNRREFKIGDRVIVNERDVTHKGRTGTVASVSGMRCWIEFDDSGQIERGFYVWWLEPLAVENERSEA